MASHLAAGTSQHSSSEYSSGASHIHFGEPGLNPFTSDLDASESLFPNTCMPLYILGRQSVSVGSHEHAMGKRGDTGRRGHSDDARRGNHVQAHPRAFEPPI